MRKLNKMAVTLAVTMVSMLASSTVYGAAPEAYTGTGELSLKKIARYDSGKSKAGKNGVEIVNFDAASNKAFIVNGDKKSMEIINLANLQSNSSTVAPLAFEKRIDIESLAPEFDDVTSIAIHPTQDLLAVAVIAEKPNKGYVAFFNKSGQYLKRVEAGYHPDMVTFTPDGTKLLVANEGEPVEADYSVDPVGSVSLIDVSGGIDHIGQDKASEITFDSLTLADIDSNVRIYPHEGGVYHKRADQPNGNNWSVDFEPEYITVDANNEFAYVTLQENNAIAKLDIASKKFVHVYGLGYKDHSLPGNGLDIATDGVVDIRNWPVLGTYMPDGMSLYQSGGKTYIVTANEGDSRDWGWTEEKKISQLDKSLIKLDASKYKGYTQEQLDAFVANDLTNDKLGNLLVTTAVYEANYGETGHAVYDAFYTFGARSFSIWDVENISAGPVYDSGDSFEQITALLANSGFNSDNEKKDSKDKRSTSKGPEPEDVKIGEINGQKYAFVGLERVGGIMTYNVTNAASPHFVAYNTERNFSKNDPRTEDLGPEGLNFVSAENSPTGKPLLLVANETSGSLAVYEITTPKYTVTANLDENTYTVGTNASGITTMTVKQGVSGLKNFEAAVDAVEAHAGKETVVFRHIRNGAQIGLSSVRADFDSTAISSGASFNVAAGDIVEVFMVDVLTNDVDKQPVVWQ